MVERLEPPARVALGGRDKEGIRIEIAATLPPMAARPAALVGEIGVPLNTGCSNRWSRRRPAAPPRSTSRHCRDVHGSERPPVDLTVDRPTVTTCSYPRADHDRTATLYERAGGTPFFEALVGRFYDGVATDPSCGRSTPRRTWPAPGIG